MQLNIIVKPSILLMFLHAYLNIYLLC